MGRIGLEIAAKAGKYLAAAVITYVSTLAANASYDVIRYWWDGKKNVRSVEE